MTKSTIPPPSGDAPQGVASNPPDAPSGAALSAVDVQLKTYALTREHVMAHNGFSDARRIVLRGTYDIRCSWTRWCDLPGGWPGNKHVTDGDGFYGYPKEISPDAIVYICESPAKALALHVHCGVAACATSGIWGVYRAGDAGIHQDFVRWLGGTLTGRRIVVVADADVETAVYRGEIAR